MNHHALATADAVETWKIAHRFVLDVYKLSGKLPAEEQHGLTAKLRTSSLKIASNIVEGYARKDDGRYAEHLTESQAALEETKYSLLVARDLGYISEESYSRVINDAEAISERLDRLHSQLAGRHQAQAEAPQAAHLPDQAAHTPAHAPAPAPAAPEIPEIPSHPAGTDRRSRRPSAFGVKKSVTTTWSDLMDWLKGGNQIKNERYDNVWTEESAVTSYLEEPNVPPRA